ncbi:MAG TPA: hypothetical protein VMQ62_05905 [Dongiaceae bacterium]|nr:hypothetical protein [Dongiaceae bacterium]
MNRRGRASRCAAAALLACGLAGGAAARATFAGDTQDAVNARWRGAWVVTTADAYTDCTPVYSNNLINGKLVSGHGRYRFKAGELAQVDEVDLKRNRVDLRMSLATPFLVPRQEGPFTLYDELTCRLQYVVEVARDLVKDGDVDGLDQVLTLIVERHDVEADARASKRYNARVREAYPADYEQTVRAHAAWRAQQTNAQVQARLEALVDETSRISDRIADDADYLAGFGKGVAAGRAARVGSCPELLAVGTQPVRGYAGPAPVAVPAGRAGDAPARFASGYADGLRLSQGLDAVRRLPACFVPVPEE